MSFSDKHLFFDLDRTLWDFEANSEAALKHILETENLVEKTGSFEHFHEVYIQQNALLWKEYGEGKITKESLRYERFRLTLHAFSIDDEDLVHRMGDAYVEISPRQTKLFPETIETLESLKKIGFNLHIITNGFQEVQFVKLENSGIRNFFDIIVCSEFIGQNKPSKAIFDFALENAGAKAEKSLMIGDDYHADISGSINAGMQAILFDPYKSSTYNYEWTIRELSEIPSLAIRLLGTK